MTYDATAQKLAVKVIGTIESNLFYSAVNYDDPITVGIAQWYGVRAAAILCRMRDQNPGAWYGVDDSIASQLESITPDNTWWNSRRLSFSEGNSLTGVMGRNQGIQNTQLTEDLDGYKAVAVAHGMNADANTGAMIFFFAMYHQGPVYALEILAAAGPTASLDALFNTCLTHVSESAGNAVLGKYGGRYRTAHELILAADITGIDPAPAPPAPVPNGNARYIQVVGDNLAAQFQDGEKIMFYPSTAGMYTPQAGAPAPTPVQPPPPADNGSWTLPLTGAGVSMTSGYGPRAFDGLASFHWGMDLAHGDGSVSDVVAPCPLKITVAYDGVGPDPSSGTAGRYVKGHTLDGAYTFNFYHMAPGSIAVAVGDTTTRGQKLGTESDTGNAAGKHLHFEAYKGAIDSPWPPPYGSPIDPLPVLRAHGVNV